MNKAILTAAAAVSAAVLLCGCAGSHSSDKKGAAAKPERPTSWSTEQRSLEEVTPNKGETQVFITKDEENDAVRLIQGVLSTEPINDEKAALDLIASYSEVMGFVDVYSELKLGGVIDYSDKLDYRFDQYCNDIKVEGSFVELTVDMTEGNKAVVLNSTYTDTWGLNTKPRVSSQDAVRCAADRFKLSKAAAKPELTIFEGPKLAWVVPVKDKEVCEVYIDAENGDIIHEKRIES